MLPMVLEEAFHTHQSLFKLLVGRAVRGAHVTGASSAERAARHNSDLFLKEQLFGELFVAHTGASDGGEGIEGPMRLAAGQANAIEARDEHGAAACIVIVHSLHIVITVAQRLQSRLLRRRSRA